MSPMYIAPYAYGILSNFARPMRMRGRNKTVSIILSTDNVCILCKTDACTRTNGDRRIIPGVYYTTTVAAVEGDGSIKAGAHEL